jgi:heat shock protein HslJ/membrane-bound inhibitor of C-type lysozyme
MNKAIQGLAGFSLVAIMAGCATEPEVEAQVYHCGAYTIEVTPLADNRLQLTAGDELYQLEPVRSGSGSAFSTGEDDERVTTFWSHGDTAMLELNSQSMPMCARPGAIIEPFTARGNEPFWHLQVDEGKARLRRPGKNDVELAVEVSRNEARSLVKASEEQLVAEITDSVCTDSMSGMPYPKTVRMTYEDAEYEGCGGVPERLLQGVTWQIQSLNDERVTEQDLTLYFSADGSISGGSGCNRFFGRYEMTGEGISMTRLGSTKRACPDEQMALESNYLDLLTSARRFRIRLADSEDASTELRLQSADGKLTATY